MTKKERQLLIWIFFPLCIVAMMPNGSLRLLFYNQHLLSNLTLSFDVGCLEHQSQEVDAHTNRKSLAALFSPSQDQRQAKV